MKRGGTGEWSWGLVVRAAAKHLEDHPKVALRCEVRDPGAAELTAEDHVVLTLGPRNSLIDVRCGDGDVMYALTFLSKETGIDAFLVEWLDKLAGVHLCDQVSTLLLIEPKTTRQVFLGEPVDEVMAMVKWALKHEGEAEFAPEKILPAWARKRGRAIGGRRTAELRSVDTTMGPDGHRALSRTPRNGTRSARAWIASLQEISYYPQSPGTAF